MKNKFGLFIILMALALLSAACAPQGAATGPGEGTAMPAVSTEGSAAAEGAGGTVVIPETGDSLAGIPDDLDEVVRVLRAAGASVELGEAVEQDFLQLPGKILRIDGEEVQIFTYVSAEELEVQASQLPDDGNPENEPQFYKMGNLLLRYVGRDPGVRDLLEDVLGAQAAGQ